VSALPYDEARRRALFISDKMAYELNLSSPQYDAVYQINLDYLLMVGRRADVHGRWWDQRNYELQQILSPGQYDLYMRTNYFYRPIRWSNGGWHYGVYSRYRDARHFYRSHPSVYSSYRGGRYFRRDARRGPAPRRNIAPPPRRNAAPAPRRNAVPPQRRDLRNGTRRYDSGTRRLPAEGRVTRNGMVQRVGGTTRTTVTVRPDPNQQQNRPNRNKGNRNRNKTRE